MSSGAKHVRCGITRRPLYLDHTASFEARAEDLVARMSVKEKISQMLHEAPAIPRLGVPAYNWWNECLHGVARAGKATVFPQAIGMAASWNPGLLRKVAAAISDEARIKHHDAVRRGNRAMYMGLDFWTPNINIFRDPRWGRGQETYGEDPYLTARMGVAFVRGLQGDHPRYLKLVATPKHYAVHSGPEKERHGFDARTNVQDLRGTYLPAFEACVREGKAWSVMGAYNRTNGEPCCGSSTLIGKILRGEWGFEGYVVSDCGALDDFHAHHKVTATPAESAALAVQNGCDLNCGGTYKWLVEAHAKGLISEEEITRSATRLMLARMKLGMFDPPAKVAFSKIPARKLDSPEHRRLALQMARESIVLLKNKGGLLPIRKEINNILVVGPNADTLDVLFGNYNGWNPRMTTILEGLVGKAPPGAKVYHARLCELTGSAPANKGAIGWHSSGMDLIIAVMGLAPRLEGEEGDAADSDDCGDRINIGLTKVQEENLKALHATGIPVVLVLTGGSSLAIPWAAANIPAIVQVWYPGEEGGTAVADVLFGDYNPAGRLPLTWVKSVDQLPPFRDYAMAGRTYRYMKEKPLYPFGFGLSYTTFTYSGLAVSRKAIGPGETFEVKVTVRNTGKVAGDEVVQLYIRDLAATAPVPRLHLEGFKRIRLAPGARRVVSFTVTPAQLSVIDDQGLRKVEPGVFELYAGGGQPGVERWGGAPVLKTRIEVR